MLPRAYPIINLTLPAQSMSMPPKWRELLTSEEYAKDPKAVLESLDVSVLYDGFDRTNNR
jgi:hypothetical protein